MPKYVNYSLLATAVVLVACYWNTCKYFINPHYLSNKDVHVVNKYYSPDGTKLILFYEYDAGATGSNENQCLINVGEENHPLTDHLIPRELTKLTWVTNNVIKALYDSIAEKGGGPYINIDLSKKVIYINHIKFIITREKEAAKLFNNYH